MSLLGAALVESVVMPGPSSQPAATGTSQPATQDSVASQPTSAATGGVESAVPVVLELRRKIEILKEAEGHLLNAWNWFKDAGSLATPDKTGNVDRRIETLKRIVRLYEVWDQVEPDKGHGRDAATWRETLAHWSPGPTSTSAPR